MDIRVSRIRTHDRGALKAHFTVEMDGFWIRDCSYFNTGSNEWMNFSQELKPLLDGDTKPKYVPYCGYVDTKKGDEVKREIIKVLKKEMSNAPSQAPKVETCDFSSDSSDLPF